MSNITYGIMASGRLGAICVKQLTKKKSVNFILTDNGSREIIELARRIKIPVFAGNPRNGNAISFVNKFKTDILLSVNYLFLIDQDIINHPKKYAINLHGSLLPKYRGRTPHVWAIINNEKETGITAHLISLECDAGDIIYQKKLKLMPEDTGASVLERFNKQYPIIMNKIIEMIESDNINPVKQDSNQATYFGKRTPDDGEINWNWQKEQIYNWVRAQARPYPGAFTFYQNKKILIHKIEYDHVKFDENDLNGKILEASELKIKTPNGVIKLIEIDKEVNIIFKNGEIFHGRY